MGLHEIKTLRLKAGSATFAGTELKIGQVAWLPDSPLISVNDREDMVVNFLHERMWDRRDWVHTGKQRFARGRAGSGCRVDVCQFTVSAKAGPPPSDRLHATHGSGYFVSSGGDGLDRHGYSGEF